MQARSSGSGRHPGTAVGYTWRLFEQEAQEERILFAAHGLENALLSYWLPAPPGIAGVHNLLINLKSGPSPQRWFSHVPVSGASARDIAALAYLACDAALAGRTALLPQFTPMRRARTVAHWLRRRPGDRGPRVLKAFASSAMRVAQAAIDDGIDLRGQVIFTGGEPLTAARYRFIRTAGARVYPRYVATEAGLIAAACGQCNGTHDQMHVYLDRLAVTQAPDASSLLFTSLSAHSPRILLNTDLGDIGKISDQRCDCLFGSLGMNTFVSDVRSPDKMTGEGISLLDSELSDLVGQLIREFGGSPDDVQFWESPDRSAHSRVVIAVSPRVKNFDEQRFRTRVLDRLRSKNPAGQLTAQLWWQAGTLQVVRADPRPSRGHKLLPITFAPSEWAKVYAPQNGKQTAQEFVFSHGSDLAVEACAARFAPGMRVLDVGCGTGAVAKRLAERGLRVLAIDYDPAMIAHARRSMTGQVEFTVADATALPVADSTFDGVVAVSLVGCVGDLRSFLLEIHRVLRPWGFAVMTFTNRRSVLSAPALCFANLKERLIGNTFTCIATAKQRESSRT